MGHDGGAGKSQNHSKSVICPKSGCFLRMVPRPRRGMLRVHVHVCMLDVSVFRQSAEI